MHVFVCCLHLCVPVLHSDGSWVFASTDVIVAWTVMYLTGYSDCLTGFHEQFSPPYRCHTGLKNV